MDEVAITEVSVVVLEMAGVKEFGDPKNTELEDDVELGTDDVVCAAAAVGNGPVIVWVDVRGTTRTCALGVTDTPPATQPDRPSWLMNSSSPFLSRVTWPDAEGKGSE